MCNFEFYMFKNFSEYKLSVFKVLIHMLPFFKYPLLLLAREIKRRYKNKKKIQFLSMFIFRSNEIQKTAYARKYSKFLKIFRQNILKRSIHVLPKLISAFIIILFCVFLSNTNMSKKHRFLLSFIMFIEAFDYFCFLSVHKNGYNNAASLFNTINAFYIGIFSLIYLFKGLMLYLAFSKLEKPKIINIENIFFDCFIYLWAIYIIFDVFIFFDNNFFNLNSEL